MSRLVWVVLAIAITAGCGTTKYTIPEVQGDSCTVGVFRDKFTLVWSMYIDVNGQTYAQLSNQTYSTFKLPVGEHKVSASWPPLSGGVPLDVPLKCEANQSYNIVFYGNYSAGTRTIRARYVSQSEAASRMEEYKPAGS